MPEYLYGLILIDSLERQAAGGAAGPQDGTLQRGWEAISRPRREKKSRTILPDTGSLAPAGA
jgi:hypothetical protein